VTKAGVVPPIVEVCADDTYTAFYESYGDDFYERYSKYRFQRMVRRNRAAAKWREEQYEKGTWLGLFTSVQLSSCATLGLAPPRRHYRLPKGASNLCGTPSLYNHRRESLALRSNLRCFSLRHLSLDASASHHSVVSMLEPTIIGTCYL
jgi:hypothetical protein